MHSLPYFCTYPASAASKSAVGPPKMDDQENPKLQIVKEVPRHPFSQLNGPMIFKTNPRRISKETSPKSSPKSVHKPMDTISPVKENGIFWCEKKD